MKNKPVPIEAMPQLIADYHMMMSDSKETGCPFLRWRLDNKGWFAWGEKLPCHKKICGHPQCHNYGKRKFDDLKRVTVLGKVVEPYEVLAFNIRRYY